MNITLIFVKKVVPYIQKIEISFRIKFISMFFSIFIGSKYFRKILDKNDDFFLIFNIIFKTTSTSYWILWYLVSVVLKVGHLKLHKGPPIKQHLFHIRPPTVYRYFITRFVCIILSATFRLTVPQYHNLIIISPSDSFSF